MLLTKYTVFITAKHCVRVLFMHLHADFVKLAQADFVQLTDAELCLVYMQTSAYGFFVKIGICASVKASAAAGKFRETAGFLVAVFINICSKRRI